MNKLILIFIMLNASWTMAQEGWTTLNIPPTIRYDDICFLNSNVGWTAGGRSKIVHKTVDGGETWTESGIFTKYLRSIEFMDANIGLCGSLESSLYRTTDGGKTWKDVAPGISPQPPGVCGLAKADKNTIYGVGIWSEPAFVIKSTNKGLNWTYIDMSAYASSLIDVYFFDADHGFVTGSKSVDEGGVVLYTDNGGQTWVEKFRTNHLGDRIWKIQTPDNVNFYGAVESYGDETRIIHSSDKGQNWEQIVVDPEYYYCQMVGFIDSMHGWTGGNATLFETVDGGVSWEKVEVGSSYNRFIRVNPGTAYMTGSMVYKFTRDVITGTTDVEPYAPVHHISVAPNPTRGNTIARVTFGNRTMAHIYLYSPTGKHMKRIFNGWVEAGEKTFELDTSELPSQQFIVIVKTNEGMESAKVVKE